MTTVSRPLGEALDLLARATPPDPGFAEDLEAVLAEVGPVRDDPWAPPETPSPASDAHTRL